LSDVDTKLNPSYAGLLKVLYYETYKNNFYLIII